MDEEVAEFARSFQRFMESMSNAAGAGRVSPMREMLDAHLGLDASSLPVVSETFPAYDHVNVQIAMTAYLHTGDRTHRIVGVSGHQRHFGALADLVEASYGMSL